MKEKIVKTIDIYNGKIVNLKRHLVKLPNDKLAFREVVKHAEGVCILPILDDKILFVKQFRSGCERILLELPAGLIDQNESPKDAAIRELREETGFSSSNISYIGGFYSSPGFTDELVHIFIAKDLFKSPLNLDEDENIQLVSFSTTKIPSLLNNNSVQDMKTALALSFYLSKSNQSIN